ncbi:MAG: YdiU family protein [Planctomycetaceae bacterium]
MDSSSRASDSFSLTFDNRFCRELPADANPVNSRRQVLRACYSRVQPTEVCCPETIAWSREVAKSLGLTEADCRSEQFAAVFGGNRLLSGMDPFAMCYGGHQFGNWAGQLGDGRAINLGEVPDRDGRHQTLQLKGAGPTPYSRTADGLAVLRSSVREFLCSEAMHHLGVPTTRALSLVLTGESVVRDMFYDGNPRREPGAVVCRVAPSFVRFGNFQIFAARRDHETLKALADFTLRSDFGCTETPDQDDYAAWFEEVCRRTAVMVAHWMRVGFVHGVMNTDNMSILGLTIDYGPYGWQDNYDPNWTPNTTDASGRRYRFGNQPAVAHWNLYQLANALLPLFDRPDSLEQSLDQYVTHYETAWHSMLSQKLGLSDWEETDVRLFADLDDVLQAAETDMTIFFRNLADVAAIPPSADSNDPAARHESLQAVSEAWYRPADLTDDVRNRFDGWLQAYRARLLRDSGSCADRVQRMNAVNPRYVLRNYLAQQAIDLSEQGDHSFIHELLNVLNRPYDVQPDVDDRLFQKRPDWARDRPGCSMLSCSS